MQLTSSQLGSSQQGEITNADCRAGAGRLICSKESWAACTRALGYSGLVGDCCMPWVNGEELLCLPPGSSPLQYNTTGSPTTFCLHTRVYMCFIQAATAHNSMLAACLGCSVKEGENGANMLHRTKIKNTPTLELKIFLNHMQTQKKNSRTQQIFVLFLSTFLS